MLTGADVPIRYVKLCILSLVFFTIYFVILTKVFVHADWDLLEQDPRRRAMTAHYKWCPVRDSGQRGSPHVTDGGPSKGSSSAEEDNRPKDCLPEDNRPKDHRPPGWTTVSRTKRSKTTVSRTTVSRTERTTDRRRERTTAIYQMGIHVKDIRFTDSEDNRPKVKDNCVNNNRVKDNQGQGQPSQEESGTTDGRNLHVSAYR